MSIETQAPSAAPDISSEVADVFGLSDFMPEASAASAPEAPSAPPEGGVVAPSPPSGETPPAAPAVPPAPAPAVAPPAAVEPAPASPQAPIPDPLAAPAPAVAPTATPAPNEEALELASLRARVAHFEALAAAPKPETPAAPSAEPAPAPGSAEAPELATPYQLAIPQETLAAVFGEDPDLAGKGLSHLVSSLANVIHQNVVKQVRSETATALAGFQASLGSSAAEQEAVAKQETMRQEYFTAYPQHNKPVLQPILAQVTMEMAAKYPGAPWDANMIAAVGQAVNTKLIEAGFNPSTVQPSAPPAAPAPKPAPFLPTGGRPASSGDGNLGDEIASTFGAV